MVADNGKKAMASVGRKSLGESAVLMQEDDVVSAGARIMGK